MIRKAAFGAPYCVKLICVYIYYMEACYACWEVKIFEPKLSKVEREENCERGRGKETRILEEKTQQSWGLKMMKGN